MLKHLLDSMLEDELDNVKFYNNERRHQANGDLTPNEVFYQSNKKVS